MARELTAYRASSFGSPLRVEASRLASRFNRPGDPPTQYLALHPLGPLAEMLRSGDLRTVEDLRELRVRTWALRVDAEPLVEIDFAGAGAFGITPDELVSDDYTACQGLAARQRIAGVRGLIVPSAALPGTRNLVIFGERIATGYLDEPVDPFLDVPASMTADPAQSPESLLELVRFRGEEDSALLAWRSGRPFRFAEPDWSFQMTG